MVREPHKAGGLTRSQPSRIRSGRDQDLGSVFVVPCGKSTADSFTVGKAIAETVATRTVLQGVVLQIPPESIREDVFVRRVRIEDISETRRATLRGRRKLERDAFSKAGSGKSDDEDPFSMLWHT